MAAVARLGRCGRPRCPDRPGRWYRDRRAAGRAGRDRRSGDGLRGVRVDRPLADGRGHDPAHRAAGGPPAGHRRDRDRRRRPRRDGRHRAVAPAQWLQQRPCRGRVRAGWGVHDLGRVASDVRRPPTSSPIPASRTRPSALWHCGTACCPMSSAPSSWPRRSISSPASSRVDRVWSTTAAIYSARRIRPIGEIWVRTR